MEQPHDSKKLVRNSFWRLSQVISSGGFAALFTFIYTASLSKSEFTVYGVAITISQMLQLLSNFGLRQAATRFIARSRGADNFADVAGYVRAGFRLSVLFSAVTLILALASNSFLTGFLSSTGNYGTIALIVAMISGFAGISLFLQGVLEGVGNFKPITLCSGALNVLQLSLVGAFLVFHLSVQIVMLIELGIMIASILFYGSQVLRVRRTWPKGVMALSPYSRTLVAYAIPLFINMVAGFLYTKVDILFVKGFLGGDDTANYFLMMHIYSFPLQALGAYIFVLNTDIAYLVGRRDPDSIRRLFFRSEKMGLSIGAFLSALFFLLSYGVVFVFPQYEGTGHLMRLVAPLLMLKCITHIASGAFMLSLGHVRAMAAFTLFGGVLNVALNYLLIPLYGVDGAVYSTLIGHTITGIATSAFVLVQVRKLSFAPEVTAAAPEPVLDTNQDDCP